MKTGSRISRSSFSSSTHKAFLLGRGPASTEKQVRQGAVTSKRFSKPGAWKPSSEIPAACSCTVSWMYETNEQSKQVRSTRSPRYSDPRRRRSIVSLSPGSGAWHTQTDAIAVAHVHARLLHLRLLQYYTRTSRLGRHAHVQQTAPHSPFVINRPTDQSRTISRSCMNVVVRLPPDPNPSRTHTHTDLSSQVRARAHARLRTKNLS